MQFIDTHTHLFLKEFNNDLENVIENALKAGIISLLLPNIDQTSLQPMLEVCNKFSQVCFPMVGLHPTSVGKNPHKELEFVENELEKNRYIAIGEIGIDLYWDKTNLQNQKTAFREQLILAVSKNMPVVIHARDSFNEIFRILDEFEDNEVKGVFHAFTGTVNEAKYIINKGFNLGIGGIITFKNSGLSETILEIGIDNLVLETDSPYLTPVPFRGKRNESSYILYVAQKVADIFNISLQEVADITTDNAQKVFNLKNNE